MAYLQKKFRFDICVCGHTMKDMIYTLKKYPKESSDTRDATLVTRFGGISNTIRGIRYLNKKIKQGNKNRHELTRLYQRMYKINRTSVRTYTYKDGNVFLSQDGMNIVLVFSRVG